MDFGTGPLPQSWLALRHGSHPTRQSFDSFPPCGSFVLPPDLGQRRKPLDDGRLTFQAGERKGGRAPACKRGRGRKSIFCEQLRTRSFASLEASAAGLPREGTRAKSCAWNPWMFVSPRKVVLAPTFARRCLLRARSGTELEPRGKTAQAATATGVAAADGVAADQRLQARRQPPLAG